MFQTSNQLGNTVCIQLTVTPEMQKPLPGFPDYSCRRLLRNATQRPGAGAGGLPRRNSRSPNASMWTCDETFSERYFSGNRAQLQHTILPSYHPLPVAIAYLLQLAGLVH